MSRETFPFRQVGGKCCNLMSSLLCQPLGRADPGKGTDPDTAAVPGSLSCGQGMVNAVYIVTVYNSRIFSHKQGTVILKFIRIGLCTGKLQHQMFRGKGIGKTACVIQGVCQYNFTSGVPGGGCNVLCLKLGKLLFHLTDHLKPKCLICGDQPGNRLGVMFRF